MKASQLLRRFNRDRKHIVIACFQKSGSSYLYQILHALTGFKCVTLVQQYGNNEQDMYEPKLQKRNSLDYISKQHVKGTDNNIRLMQTYGIKPVVLVRNIYDILYSLRDHFEREDHRTPTGYVHRDYFKMTEDEKFNYLIRIHLPWYFNFYVSWLEAAKSFPCFWTTYQELFGDQVRVLSGILDFYSIPYTEPRLLQAMQEMRGKDTRLNVGKAGRGQSLSVQHRREIIKLAQAWNLEPGVWERIGIEGDQLN